MVAGKIQINSLKLSFTAELADVLRKRRNRPDASDEDLGLPRSPASPQRRAGNLQHHAMASASTPNGAKLTIGERHGEASSLSLLSMNCTEGEDLLTNTITTNNSATTEISTDFGQECITSSRYSRSSMMSTTSDILRHRDSQFTDDKNEVDLFSSDWQRLSHSAAKHKMAIRPTKKKGGPSRHHRRTLETSIPEANEDFSKFINKQISDVKDIDAKVKTRSLPPGANATLLMAEPHTVSKESIAKTTKITTSNTTQSTTTSNTTTTNIFGLRTLTAKASAMFESKDHLQSEEVTKKSEVFEKNDAVDKAPLPVETIETGFLRRILHRNSKRSIAKANVGDEDQDEIDKKQNEPKKIQMSPSVFAANTNSNALEKFNSEYVSYENMVEEKRKEFKRDIYTDGKTACLNSLANNFATPIKDEKKSEAKSPSKSKSGPAARQRYLPQNIVSEDQMRINGEISVSREPVLPRSLTSETFQSTSIVREITKQQSTMNSNSAKPEHHFEKKPKIVGLSAFQQKVSRSNDSFARVSSANTSMVSLDTSEDDLSSSLLLQAYEQKQRKSLEKSRSFRAYGEPKYNSPTTVHNNMPSLPDLSLNLRVPYNKDFVLNENGYSLNSPPELLDEKHASLGFEINDNKLLVKPEKEAKKTFGNYDKTITTTTSTNCAAYSKNTPTNLITPGAVAYSCSISSLSSCNKNVSESESNIDLIAKSPFVNVIRKSINLSEEQSDEVVNISAPSVILTERRKPPVLTLKKEKSLSEDNVFNAPSTTSVALRDKPVFKANTQFSSSVEQTKEFERKSAPANNSNKSANGFRSNSTRRSSSVVESREDNSQSTVPEFMKIQLNRVDPCKSSKGHVVLAKNMKEIPLPKSRESSPEINKSMDDLCFRRLSSESVDINERKSPETEKRFSGLYHETINKQTKVSIGLPPRSPIKKIPTTPTTPPTPTINERELAKDHFKLPDTFEQNSSSPSTANSLSLQERRRLFMNDETTKMERKMEEIRYERKKSICGDMSKKSASKSESEQRESFNKDLSPTDSGVILRKKSFASSLHSLNGNSINNNNNDSNKDDSTPELIKVFARRSLKIKDEDIDKMLNSNGNNGINILSAPQTLKKFNSPSSNPSLDSDKENQSASDEKLDKLSKLEINHSMSTAKTHSSQNHNTSTALNGATNNNNNCNRNSLADFRVGVCKMASSSMSINTNNNNSCSNEESPASNSSKSFLPPIKAVGGYRPLSIERNNNHNIALPPTKISSTLERPTLKLADLNSSSSSTDSPLNINKAMERSATMGEFKGIHQRRAEWEQRAKEALK